MPPGQAQVVAERIKDDGNVLFRKGKFKAAIDCYTEAIAFDSSLAVLYVNRAMCHKKLSNWDQVVRDSKTALALQSDLMKAHYLLGVALLQLQDENKAIVHLRKALDSAREKGDAIKDEIWRELARAKYAQWKQESSSRSADAAKLQQQLSAACEAAGTTPDQAAWDALFARASQMDQVGEVPSAFTCPLTMEVFREPVITPSGNSYERSALMEHLSKVGKWDPISRVPMSESDVRPNIALRNSTEHYLNEHPWAWGECM
jgi:STIP1 family protein 1